MNHKIYRFLAAITVFASLVVIFTLPVFAIEVIKDPGTSANMKEAFAELIDFFEGWITAFGCAVAFVGAIMFGFAIKEEQADGKAKALTTIASGAMIAAITATNLIFDVNSAGGAADLNQIMRYFAAWASKVGCAVAFIGALMFGFAIKSEDAEAKTRGLMTMVAGITVLAVSKSLELFGFI